MYTIVYVYIYMYTIDWIYIYSIYICNTRYGWFLFGTSAVYHHTTNWIITIETTKVVTGGPRHDLSNPHYGIYEYIIMKNGIFYCSWGIHMISISEKNKMK